MNEEEQKDGITKLIFNDNEYVFWNKAEIVLPSVYEYLKSNFPAELILSEFNHIDFVVLGENLPVEVQSTIIYGNSKNDKKSIGSSYFEQMIEKQIKQNIERYGRCWFFFDSEFLRYLHTNISKANRLDLRWLIAYIRDNKLKVFVVDCKGEIKPVTINDLEIIVDSVTYDKFDDNEISIFSQVLSGNRYTSNEIRSYWNNKKLSQDKGAFVTWLRKKDQPEKEKRLGYILQTISGFLLEVDHLFAREEVDWNCALSSASFLGILNYEKGYWCLEDYYDVAKYFPSYNKHIYFWDNLKYKKIKRDEFKILIEGA